MHKKNGLLCEEHRPSTRLSDNRSFAQSYKKELDAAEIILGDGWPHGQPKPVKFLPGIAVDLYQTQHGFFKFGSAGAHAITAPCAHDTQLTISCITPRPQLQHSTAAKCEDHSAGRHRNR